VLSWPERDGDIELLRSPLLAQLELRDDVALPLEQTLPLRHVAFNERPALEVLQDDRAPALSAQSARGGARTLELQSRCPFRAQAELRLRAPRMPRVSLGVEPVDRGAILHRVLEDIWGSLRTQEALLNIDDVALEPRVRESAQRHAVRALLPDSPHRTRLVALEIDSVVKLIMRLLRVERLRPAFSVQVAEAAEQYRIGSLSVTLRPDRIDLLDGGGQLLIDYKLGDAHRPRDWVDVWPGRPRRPQLPLYGLAHAESLKGLAYAVLAPGAVEYRGWSDGTPIGTGVLPYPAGIRIDLGDPGDWEALLHHWRFTLTRLAEQYVSGDARVDPLPQECATCHLSVLCRINEKTADNPVVEAANDDE
jgi:ATP-dependent helicase/DNAse subunit B